MGKHLFKNCINRPKGEKLLSKEAAEARKRGMTYGQYQVYKYNLECQGKRRLSRQF